LNLRVPGLVESMQILVSQPTRAKRHYSCSRPKVADFVCLADWNRLVPQQLRL
jgi:hypothetical protein